MDAYLLANAAKVDSVLASHDVVIHSIQDRISSARPILESMVENVVEMKDDVLDLRDEFDGHMEQYEADKDDLEAHMEEKDHEMSINVELVQGVINKFDDLWDKYVDCEHLSMDQKKQLMELQKVLQAITPKLEALQDNDTIAHRELRIAFDSIAQIKAVVQELDSRVMDQLTLELSDGGKIWVRDFFREGIQQLKSEVIASMQALNKRSEDQADELNYLRNQNREQQKQIDYNDARQDQLLRRIVAVEETVARGSNQVRFINDTFKADFKKVGGALNDEGIAFANLSVCPCTVPKPSVSSNVSSPGAFCCI